MSSFFPFEKLVLKTIFFLNILYYFNMTSINMDYVAFYNPNLAHKPSHTQLKILVVKKHRPPL